MKKIIKYFLIGFAIFFIFIFMLYTGFDSDYRTSHPRYYYEIDWNKKIDFGIINQSIAIMNCSNKTNDTLSCFK